MKATTLFNHNNISIPYFSSAINYFTVIKIISTYMYNNMIEHYACRTEVLKRKIRISLNNNVFVIRSC